MAVLFAAPSRINNISKAVPRNQLVHATEKNLFARAPPFLIELAISEGQLMVHQ